MVIWNALEDLRRRENLQRGYVEVKTPLIYDIEALGDLGPLGEVPREHVPDPVDDEHELRAEADELPGPHAPLRQPAAELPRAAAPLRRVGAAAPRRARRARCTACCASATSPRTTRTSSARASRSRTRSSAASTIAAYLYELFGLDCALRALDAAREQARHRRGVGLHRGRAARRRSSAAGSSTTLNEGDGAFYGPKIDLHMTDVARPLVADGDDPARRADAAAFGLTYVGADNTEHTPVRHPPRAASARSSGSSAS